MIVSPIPGQTPDRSSEHTLQGLASNLNAYAEQFTPVVTAGTSVVLTPAQVVAKNLRLEPGAGGAFTLTLPPTSKIIDALGATVSIDGSYWFPFYVFNHGVGQTATLTAGDANTTVDPVNATVADGHISKWMVNVQQAANASLPMTLYFHFCFTANVGSGGISGGNLPQVALWASPTSLYGDANFTWDAVAIGAAVQTPDLAVPNESFGTGHAANTPQTYTVLWPSIKPGSITLTGLTSGPDAVITDDGNGNLVGDIGSGGTNTVNYTTGALNFSFNATTTTSNFLVYTSRSLGFTANRFAITPLGRLEFFDSVPNVVWMRKDENLNTVVLENNITQLGAPAGGFEIPFFDNGGTDFARLGIFPAGSTVANVLNFGVDVGSTYSGPTNFTVIVGSNFTSTVGSSTALVAGGSFAILTDDAGTGIGSFAPNSNSTVSLGLNNLAGRWNQAFIQSVLRLGDPTGGSSDFILTAVPGLLQFTSANGGVFDNGAWTWDVAAETFASTGLSYLIEFDNSNSGSSTTINWANASIQRLTLTAACAITLDTPTYPGHYQLRLIQDGNSGWTVTWAGAAYSGSRWLGAGSAPAINLTNLGETIIRFYFDGTKFVQELLKVGS